LIIAKKKDVIAIKERTLRGNSNKTTENKNPTGLLFLIHNNVTKVIAHLFQLLEVNPPRSILLRSPKTDGRHGWAIVFHVQFEIGWKLHTGR